MFERNYIDDIILSIGNKYIQENSIFNNASKARREFSELPTKGLKSPFQCRFLRSFTSVPKPRAEDSGPSAPAKGKPFKLIV